MTSLDEAKGLLYAHDPSEFIAARDALVKEIRAGGDRDLANTVKTLRKPSAVAGEVNRVARADPDGVELILQAAELLRAAQTGALDGSSIDASELQQHYRAAIQALAATATSKKVEVRLALEAATIDMASNDNLRRGCLVVVPSPGTIFDVASDSAPASDPPKPVDELDARRRAKESQRAKEQVKAEAKVKAEAEAIDDQAAKEAADKQAAALEKQAAKEAAALEKERQREQARLRKEQERERKRKHNELTKAHREALRAQLAALDAKDAASSNAEDAAARIVTADDELEQLEQTRAELVERRAEAIGDKETADQQDAAADEQVREAQAAVDALAEALATLDSA